MIPKPGIPRYTPSDETRKSTPSGHDRWKKLALEGRYALLISEMKESGRFDGDELEELWQTYSSMMRFYASGADDAGRETYHRDIGRRLYSRVQKDEEEQLILRDPHHIRTDLIRSLGTRGIEWETFGGMVVGLKNIGDRSEVFYALLEDLFNKIWTTIELPEEAEEALGRLLWDTEEKEASRAIVGALFIGVMEFFDPVKMRLLLHASRVSGLPSTQGAATAAMLFAARRHQEVILRFYPGLAAQAKGVIEDDPALKRLIYDCIIDSHISYDTKEDHRIFLQEILPTLKNVQNMLGSVPGKDLAERMKNLSLSMDETNESQTELRRMMEQAASRLGSEDFRSHDLEYHNAVHMKMHPFFVKPLNWFLLFDPKHPALDASNAETMRQLEPVVFQGRQIISSDLYSYGLMVDWRPIAAQIAGMGADIPTEAQTPPARDARSGMRDFIFGAYRFYHLFVAGDRFHNPFDAMPYLLDGAFTQIPCLYDEEEYLDLAGALGAQKHYISAGYTYARLVEEWGSDSSEAWRGLAVANIRLGAKTDALFCLDKAIEDEGITSVTAINKANILRELGRRGEAVIFLEKAEAEADESEIYALTLKRARMLEELGRTEEAISAGFKADYLEEEIPGKRDAKRFLIRLLLEEGRKNEALQKAENAQESDPLYYGIALLASGKRAEGIRKLREWRGGAAHLEQEKETLSELLKILSRYDVPEWEEALIFDSVMAEV